MTILGPKQLNDLGVRLEDVTPAVMNIVTANEKPMARSGMVLIKITATSSGGQEFISRQQAYVMPEANHLFLSRECLEDFGVIDRRQFPEVGMYPEEAKAMLVSDRPPGPLGVVNPQASPPVVLGGPRGPRLLWGRWTMLPEILLRRW